MFGLMIQLDGSDHDWFEGRGPRCTLLVFIDDATSQIVHLEFVKREAVHALMTATERYIPLNGIPVAFMLTMDQYFMSILIIRNMIS